MVRRDDIYYSKPIHIRKKVNKTPTINVSNISRRLEILQILFIDNWEKVCKANRARLGFFI